MPDRGAAVDTQAQQAACKAHPASSESGLRRWRRRKRPAGAPRWPPAHPAPERPPTGAGWRPPCPFCSRGRGGGCGELHEPVVAAWRELWKADPGAAPPCHRQAYELRSDCESQARPSMQQQQQCRWKPPPEPTWSCRRAPAPPAPSRRPAPPAPRRASRPPPAAAQALAPEGGGWAGQDSSHKLSKQAGRQGQVCFTTHKPCSTAAWATKVGASVPRPARACPHVKRRPCLDQSSGRASKRAHLLSPVPQLLAPVPPQEIVRQHCRAKVPLGGLLGRPLLVHPPRQRRAVGRRAFAQGAGVAHALLGSGVVPPAGNKGAAPSLPQRRASRSAPNSIPRPSPCSPLSRSLQSTAGAAARWTLREA